MDSNLNIPVHLLVEIKLKMSKSHLLPTLRVLATFEAKIATFRHSGLQFS